MLPQLTPPAIVGSAEACPAKDDDVKLTDDLRRQYSERFASLQINRDRETAIGIQIAQMSRAIDRYQAIAAKTGVPWFVIALIHHRECSGRWDCHLHNGDSLAARTRNDPAGRPVTGNPPFTWEASAVDAITYEAHIKAWDDDWSLAATLFKLEQYNGLGYVKEGVPSPYLWSGSSIYTSGKFTRDHFYDPHFVDAQLGVAVVLRRMVSIGVVNFTEPAIDNQCEGKR